MSPDQYMDSNCRDCATLRCGRATPGTNRNKIIPEEAHSSLITFYHRCRACFVWFTNEGLPWNKIAAASAHRRFPTLFIQTRKWRTVVRVFMVTPRFVLVPNTEWNPQFPITSIYECIKHKWIVSMYDISVSRILCRMQLYPQKSRINQMHK